MVGFPKAVRTMEAERLNLIESRTNDLRERVEALRGYL